MNKKLVTLRSALTLTEEARDDADKWRLFHDNADSGWDRDKVDQWRKVRDEHRSTCDGLRYLIREEEECENVRRAAENRANAREAAARVDHTAGGTEDTGICPPDSRLPDAP